MFLKSAFIFMLCSCGIAQTQAPWPCRDDIRKADPNAVFVRVSDRVMNAMAQSKSLPDVSDIKGKNVDSIVVIHVIVDSQGGVRCSEIQEGDTTLNQRSLDAAQKWRYQPYHT